jgi:hypothetical protein
MFKSDSAVGATVASYSVHHLDQPFFAAMVRKPGSSCPGTNRRDGKRLRLTCEFFEQQARAMQNTAAEIQQSINNFTAGVHRPAAEEYELEDYAEYDVDDAGGASSSAGISASPPSNVAVAPAVLPMTSKARPTAAVGYKPKYSSLPEFGEEIFGARPTCDARFMRPVPVFPPRPPPPPPPPRAVARCPVPPSVPPPHLNAAMCLASKAATSKAAPPRRLPAHVLNAN